METVVVAEELVRRQMENEEMILDRGIQKYRQALREARDEGRMADTMPGRWLSSTFIEPIAMQIRKCIAEAQDGKPGPCATHVPMMTQLEPDVYAYVAIRTIFNSVLGAKGRCDKAKVRSRMERELREEMQHNHMDRERSATYKYWMREAQRAPDPRTKQRCLARLKRNFPDLPSFRSEAERFALSALCAHLIYIILQTTGIASIVMQTERIGEKIKKKDYLVLNPEFFTKLDAINAKAETLWPKFEPMLCPPRPWTGAYKGGFVGKLGERSFLIRACNRSYLDDVHSAIQGGKMKNVLKALNAVQATAWRINRRIFEVMRTALDEGGISFRLPSKMKVPAPEYPANKPDSEAVKEYANKVKAAQRLEAKRVSKYFAVKNALTTADAFKDETAIWFAHNLDWRGRIYPMSSYLSPQGDELSRALLEFARGLPLETDEAVEWLAIHGAGCFGYDKVSFADRVKWVHDHERYIREAAENPLDCRAFWTEADKPWMFLAWCFDWVGYLDNGLSHVSHLPVAMDGSCNGLQNFAAMLRHEETAVAVNLAPSEKPNDIYQRVADKLKPRIQALAESESWSTEEILPELEARNRLEYADKDAVAKEKKRIKKLVDEKKITRKEATELRKGIAVSVDKEERRKTADMWDVVAARWIWKHIDRKLVKRPVMTYPYAVTLYGIRDQLIEALLDLHGEGKTQYPVEHIGKVAQMLRLYVHAAIRETVVAAAQAMEWLRAAAEVVAEGNLPVKWVSPVGMLVMQNYWESTKQYVRLRVGSVQYRATAYAKKEGFVKKSRQASGVAPNFVHSCDASHLMLTVLACEASGLCDFHMIHDSFGTHARNADLLASELRKEFVAMYDKRNILHDFYEQLKDQLRDREALVEQIPPPPEQEDFDLTQVLASKYFFA